METYEAYKTCKACATKYPVTLSKLEAAFDGLSSDKLKKSKCPVCSETDFQSAGLASPEIDKELIEIWSQDENLYFSQQDEDLILTDTDIELLIEFIDKKDILPSKRATLLGTLCVIVFDSLDAKDRAKEALSKRKDMLLEATEYIYAYIKDFVFPIIGLKIDLKIKVCGMRSPDNIAELSKLPIDYMGMIFYPKSPRYVADLSPGALDDALHENIGRVGVFVNEDIETVCQIIEKYDLNQVQLHGNETPEYCAEVWNRTCVEIFKAFSISEVADFEQTKSYEEVCQAFIFDTKTPEYGGSGMKFDWNILEAYKGDTTFLLSGGIGADDAEAIKNITHPMFMGVDINSRFETEPGMKDIRLIEKFIKALKNE